MTKSAVPPSGEVVIERSRPVCCRDFELGTCRSEMSRAELRRWSANKAVLMDLTRLASESDGLLLIRMSCEAHGAEHQPLLLLLAAMLLRPIIPALHVFSPATVSVGERAVAVFGNGIDDGFLSQPRLLSRMGSMREAGNGIRLESLSYTWVSGVEVEIQGSEDITDTLGPRPGPPRGHDEVLNLMIDRAPNRRAPRQPQGPRVRRGGGRALARALASSVFRKPLMSMYFAETCHLKLVAESTG